MLKWIKTLEINGLDIGVQRADECVSVSSYVCKRTKANTNDIRSAFVTALWQTAYEEAGEPQDFDIALATTSAPFLIACSYRYEADSSSIPQGGA